VLLSSPWRLELSVGLCCFPNFGASLGIGTYAPSSPRVGRVPPLSGATTLRRLMLSICMPPMTPVGANRSFSVSSHSPGSTSDKDVARHGDSFSNTTVTVQRRPPRVVGTPATSGFRPRYSRLSHHDRRVANGGRFAAGPRIERALHPSQCRHGLRSPPRHPSSLPATRSGTAPTRARLGRIPRRVGVR
jgi:hypothetical protein